MEKKQSPTSIHEKNQTPWTIREKNQTPWTIWFFLWILQKHRIFLSLFYFSKNLAMFSFVLLSRLQANHCWMYKKMTMFKKNTNTFTYPISIREKTQTPWTIQYFGDLAKFSRILEIFVKKLINNYTFEKTKHLELSDTISGHSQIFSDTI